MIFLFAEVCQEEMVYQTEGAFVWPLTSVGVKAVLPCPRNPKSVATRFAPSHAVHFRKHVSLAMNSSVSVPQTSGFGEKYSMEVLCLSGSAI